MIPGARNELGVLQVSSALPGAGTSYIGGFALTPVGEVLVHVSDLPTRFANGFGFNTAGQLCVAPGGTIFNFVCGLPFTWTGRLVVQNNQSPASNEPYVGGVRVGPLGGVYVTGVGEFSPISLFAAGEQGVWYDPSDLSTMFQDSAGTTPVTADGQPVGKILDKSGRGNHASQTTAAARPLYKTDGTYHWLQFDGVDDSIVSSPFSSNIVDGVTNILGLSPISIMNQAVTYDGNANDSMQLYNHLATGAQRVYAATSGSSTFATLIAGLKYVITNQFNQASGFSRVNRSQFATSTGSVNTNLIRIGRKLSTSYNNIKLFGFISRVIQLNSTEITDTETWINGKTGAY